MRAAPSPQPSTRRSSSRGSTEPDAAELASAEAELFDRCHAAQARMGVERFFSHTTAARIYGLCLPREIERKAELHISTVAPRRAPKGAGVIGHRLRIDQDSLRIRSGLRVPQAVEVWCELASLLEGDDLVCAGDALLRRKNPLTEPDALRMAVEAATDRPRVDRLRRALRLIRPRTDSPMETRLRLALIRARLPEPGVNIAILDSRDSFIGFGDLVYTGARVVVEYDGDHHRSDPAQYSADVDRHWRMQNAGWQLVRLDRAHLRNNAHEAVNRVRQALTPK
ncbi:DUF559 domain-containing protein [Leifsonia poae]|nr:DUF559 domain-containing protein [Leifsonia poae]